MRRFLLLIVLVLTAALAPVQAFGVEPDFDPFPLGTCARLSVMDSKPICVIVDPEK